MELMAQNNTSCRCKHHTMSVITTESEATAVDMGEQRWHGDS